MPRPTGRHLHRFVADNGKTYEIRVLTPALTRHHARAFLRIHNLIPHVRWREQDLFAKQARDGASYLGRDVFSLAVFEAGKPAGLLIAYLRDPSFRHPLESVYVHRIAIDSSHQSNGVGTYLLRFAISSFFRSLPWLLSVTAQTNDEPSNDRVLAFYRSLGLRQCYKVDYPNKQDLLFEIARSDWWHNLGQGSAQLDINKLRLAGTRFADRSPLGPSTVHFGTGSREKLQQYSYLFRCYGIALKRLHLVTALTEPQVEGFGEASEQALVAEPLKWFSRFAARANTYPIVIEDTMLFIEHFNEDFAEQPILPGADTKRWWSALGSDGVLRVMKGSRRRQAKYVCQLGVNIGPRSYRVFRSELLGRIATRARSSQEAIDEFPYTNATFFHSIFIPDGIQKTLAQLEACEFREFDYRRHCVELAVEEIHRVADISHQEELFDPAE